MTVFLVYFRSVPEVLYQILYNLSFLKSEISKKVKGQEDFSRLFFREK